MRQILLTLVILSLSPACGGGGAYRQGAPSAQCVGVEAFKALAKNLAMIVRIVEVNLADPDQVVAELHAFADERKTTTDCLRALMPQINEELGSNPAVLKRYAQVVAPEIQKHDELQKAHPEIFKYPGVREAIKRLL